MIKTIIKDKYKDNNLLFSSALKLVQKTLPIYKK